MRTINKSCTMQNLSFLPSEIARLVLGYLSLEGYEQSHKAFLKECSHLKELNELSGRGRKCYTTISGKSLQMILDEYATLDLLDTRWDVETISREDAKEAERLLKELSLLLHKDNQSPCQRRSLSMTSRRPGGAVFSNLGGVRMRMPFTPQQPLSHSHPMAITSTAASSQMPAVVQLIPLNTNTPSQVLPRVSSQTPTAVAGDSIVRFSPAGVAISTHSTDDTPMPDAMDAPDNGGANQDALPTASTSAETSTNLHPPPSEHVFLKPKTPLKNPGTRHLDNQEFKSPRRKGPSTKRVSKEPMSLPGKPLQLIAAAANVNDPEDDPTVYRCAEKIAALLNSTHVVKSPLPAPPDEPPPDIIATDADLDRILDSNRPISPKMMESLLHNVYNDLELGEYFSEGAAVSSAASTSHRDTTHDLHTPPLPIAEEPMSQETSMEMASSTKVPAPSAAPKLKRQARSIVTARQKRKHSEQLRKNLGIPLTLTAAEELANKEAKEKPGRKNRRKSTAAATSHVRTLFDGEVTANQGSQSQRPTDIVTDGSKPAGPGGQSGVDIDTATSITSGGPGNVWTGSEGACSMLEEAAQAAGLLTRTTPPPLLSGIGCGIGSGMAAPGIAPGTPTPRMHLVPDSQEPAPTPGNSTATQSGIEAMFEGSQDVPSIPDTQDMDVSLLTATQLTQGLTQGLTQRPSQRLGEVNGAGGGVRAGKGVVEDMDVGNDLTGDQIVSVTLMSDYTDSLAAHDSTLNSSMISLDDLTQPDGLAGQRHSRRLANKRRVSTENPEDNPPADAKPKPKSRTRSRSNSKTKNKKEPSPTSTEKAKSEELPNDEKGVDEGQDATKTPFKTPSKVAKGRGRPRGGSATKTTKATGRKPRAKREYSSDIELELAKKKLIKNKKTPKKYTELGTDDIERKPESHEDMIARIVNASGSETETHDATKKTHRYSDELRAAVASISSASPQKNYVVDMPVLTQAPPKYDKSHEVEKDSSVLEQSVEAHCKGAETKDETVEGQGQPALSVPPPVTIVEDTCDAIVAEMSKPVPKSVEKRHKTTPKKASLKVAAKAPRDPDRKKAVRKTGAKKIENGNGKSVAETDTEDTDEEFMDVESLLKKKPLVQQKKPQQVKQTKTMDSDSSSDSDEETQKQGSGAKKTDVVEKKQDTVKQKGKTKPLDLDSSSDSSSDSDADIQKQGSEAKKPEVVGKKQTPKKGRMNLLDIDSDACSEDIPWQGSQNSELGNKKQATPLKKGQPKPMDFDSSSSSDSDEERKKQEKGPKTSVVKKKQATPLKGQPKTMDFDSSSSSDSDEDIKKQDKGPKSSVKKKKLATPLQNGKPKPVDTGSSSNSDEEMKKQEKGPKTSEKKRQEIAPGKEKPKPLDFGSSSDSSSDSDDEMKKQEKDSKKPVVEKKKPATPLKNAKPKPVDTASSSDSDEELTKQEKGPDKSVVEKKKTATLLKNAQPKPVDSSSSSDSDEELTKQEKGPEKSVVEKKKPATELNKGKPNPMDVDSSSSSDSDEELQKQKPSAIKSEAEEKKQGIENKGKPKPMELDSSSDSGEEIQHRQKGAKKFEVQKKKQDAELPKENTKPMEFDSNSDGDEELPEQEKGASKSVVEKKNKATELKNVTPKPMDVESSSSSDSDEEIQKKEKEAKSHVEQKRQDTKLQKLEKGAKKSVIEKKKQDSALAKEKTKPMDMDSSSESDDEIQKQGKGPGKSEAVSEEKKGLLNGKNTADTDNDSDSEEENSVPKKDIPATKPVPKKGVPATKPLPKKVSDATKTGKAEDSDSDTDSEDDTKVPKNDNNTTKPVTPNATKTGKTGDSNSDSETADDEEVLKQLRKAIHAAKQNKEPMQKDTQVANVSNGKKLMDSDSESESEGEVEKAKQPGKTVQGKGAQNGKQDPTEMDTQVEGKEGEDGKGTGKGAEKRESPISDAALQTEATDAPDAKITDQSISEEEEESFNLTLEVSGDSRGLESPVVKEAKTTPTSTKDNDNSVKKKKKKKKDKKEHKKKRKSLDKLKKTMKETAATANDRISPIASNADATTEMLNTEELSMDMYPLTQVPSTKKKKNKKEKKEKKVKVKKEELIKDIKKEKKSKKKEKNKDKKSPFKSFLFTDETEIKEEPVSGGEQERTSPSTVKKQKKKKRKSKDKPEKGKKDKTDQTAIKSEDKQEKNETSPVEKSQPEKSQPEKPQPEKPQAEKPQAEKPQAQKSQPDKSQNDNTQPEVSPPMDIKSEPQSCKPKVSSADVAKASRLPVTSKMTPQFKICRVSKPQLNSTPIPIIEAGTFTPEFMTDDDGFTTLRTLKRKMRTPKGKSSSSKSPSNSGKGISPSTPKPKPDANDTDKVTAAQTKPTQPKTIDTKAGSDNPDNPDKPKPSSEPTDVSEKTTEGASNSTSTPISAVTTKKPISKSKKSPGGTLDLSFVSALARSTLERRKAQSRLGTNDQAEKSEKVGKPLNRNLSALLAASQMELQAAGKDTEKENSTPRKRKASETVGAAKKKKSLVPLSGAALDPGLIQKVLDKLHSPN